MPAPTPSCEPEAAPRALPAPPSPAPAPSRHARTLAIGSVVLAVLLGVTFGQVTGSLSDAATSPTGEGAAGDPEERQMAAPPPSVPAASAEGPDGEERAAAPATTSPPDPPPSHPAAVTAEAEPEPEREPGSGSGSGTDPVELLAGGGTLALGDRGGRVRALEDRLHELGYWPGDLDGTFDEPTRQAVIAFQKAEDLDAVDGAADADVVERLATASFGWGRTRSGQAIEIDRERQLLFVVEDGAVVWTLNTATGSGLRRRRHRVERQIDAGYDAPGGTIHRPRYFDGAIAIQGTGERPDPPPQGCACLTDAAMDMLWSIDAGAPGTPVVVY